MRVVDAVFASCALPCIFTPFRYEGRIFLDGGVVQNRPLCHGTGEAVLHCLLEDPERVALSPPPANLFDFGAVLLACSIETQNRLSPAPENCLCCYWKGEAVPTEELFTLEPVPALKTERQVGAGFAVAANCLAEVSVRDVVEELGILQDSKRNGCKNIGLRR